MTTHKTPTKILIVDDESALRESVVAYLEDSGFVICEAANGKAGLEVFIREKPDLVLTDIQMPIMNGLAFLSEILKISPKTPVVVVSGAGSMDDVIEALICMKNLKELNLLHCNISHNCHQKLKLLPLQKYCSNFFL